MRATFAAGLCSLFILAGCSGGSSSWNPAEATQSETVIGASLSGKVHGGQQPIAGAHVFFFAANTTGYGSPSISLLQSGQGVTGGGDYYVITDPGGNFTLSPYTCPASPNDQTYLVATGGDSGSGVNANIALMTALGTCGNLSPSTFVYVNEVTTVASTYALSGFMSDYAHVGTSSTNYIGLKNAMATVNNLVNSVTGAALTVTPAYSTQAPGTTSATFKSTVPQSEIYTLANILAACVNTNGVGGSSGNCVGLFGSGAANTTTGGVSGTPDTIQAALNIAQNPGTNVDAVYAYNLPLAPFSPVLATAPNDWTISLNFVGGGMGGTAGTNDSGSTALAIDGSGNIWVANNRRNSITELNNLGVPQSPNTFITPSVVLGGFTGGGLTNPTSIAADLLGNIWIGNSSAVLSKFTSAGIPVGSGFTGGGLTTGVTVAIDGFDNVWIGGYGGPSVGALSEFSNSGTPLSGTGFTSDIANPIAIAVDGAESIWVVNVGNGFVDKFNQAGTLTNDSGTVLANPGLYAAIDASGQFWSPYITGILTFASNAAWTGANYQTFSISSPTAISIDGANHVWIASAGGAEGQANTANLTELTTSGTPITPAATGYQGTMVNSRGGGIDASGNLWLVNGTVSSSVAEFVGVAAPTYMPLAAAVQHNAIGQKP